MGRNVPCQDGDQRATDEGVWLPSLKERGRGAGGLFQEVTQSVLQYLPCCYEGGRAREAGSCPLTGRIVQGWDGMQVLL